MDMRCQMRGDEAEILVDVLEDAATRANGLTVEAEVFHVAAEALGAPLRSLKKLNLRQEGPGSYEGTFSPDEAGVYLVRTQAGGEMVSAGLVHQSSSEASLGTVNQNLLESVVKITGGQILSVEQGLPAQAAIRTQEHVELWPLLVKLLVVLWLVDVVIRRWEHVLGLFGRVAA